MVHYQLSVDALSHECNPTGGNIMNKSLIWITAGVAAVGFGIPAFAAISSPASGPITTPAATVVSLPHSAGADDASPTGPSTPRAVVVPVVVAPTNAPTIIDDKGGTCAGTEAATDDRCTGVDAHDVNDDATSNSVDDVNDDATSNSVEDVSGRCDEAEHANDPSCTVAPAGNTAAASNSTVTSIDDNSGRGSGGHGGADDSGHGGSSHG
jgi:hypothetical protein